MTNDQFDALARLSGGDSELEKRLDEAVRKIRQYAEAFHELNPDDEEQS